MLVNIVTVTVLRTGTQFLDILDSTLLESTRDRGQAIHPLPLKGRSSRLLRVAEGTIAANRGMGVRLARQSRW